MVNVNYYFVIGLSMNRHGIISIKGNTEFKIPVNEKLYNSYLKYLEDKENAPQKFCKIELEKNRVDTMEMVLDFDKILYAYVTTKEDEEDDNRYINHNYTRCMSRSF